MKKINSTPRHLVVLAGFLAAFVAFSPAAHAQAASNSNPPASKPGVLDRAQTGTLLPHAVFFKGASATVQDRNSAGIRFPGGALTLAVLVDVSGYSSEVQQTYQGYLLNEVHLRIGDKTLPPGAYGFGFVAGNRAVILDISGHELLNTATTHDDKLARPNPLQILPDPTMPGHYRLYLGRNYVTLSEAK
ncbi:MAG: hypothetical protein WBY53_17395 [Acidobacteriaceae bacterium]